MKFNALVPELTVTDFENSKSFYTKVVGFKLLYKRPKPKFGFFSLGRAQIMLEERNGSSKIKGAPKPKKPLGAGINFQIEVKNVDGLLKRIKRSGFAPLAGPHVAKYKVKGKQIYSKEFFIIDPDGYLLRFLEEIRPPRSGFGNQKSNL